MFSVGICFSLLAKCAGTAPGHADKLWSPVFILIAPARPKDDLFRKAVEFRLAIDAFRFMFADLLLK